MLGNDVVDLRDLDTRPETFRPRFDERVFAPLERRAIERDPQPHARRWAHWAAKEAAYKLAKQVDADFVFSPVNLVARFSTAVDPPGDRVERRGTLELPYAIAPGIRNLELRSFETPDRVHVLALPAGSDWEAVVSAVEPVLQTTDSSVAVRNLAIQRIAQDLGVAPPRIAIGCRGRIPTVEIDGSRSTMAISLSHHGGWIACAMTLRFEGTIPISRATNTNGGSVGDRKASIRRAAL
jgi:hypothetical protein